jgi:hypothetical protein
MVAVILARRMPDGSDYFLPCSSSMVSQISSVASDNSPAGYGTHQGLDLRTREATKVKRPRLEGVDRRQRLQPGSITIAQPRSG